MTEENNPGSEAVGLPPATQKTKEQWLEEGKVLMFYAPIRYEEALAAFEQALRLDPNDGLTYRMKGMALRALRRNEEALAAYEQAIVLDATDAEAHSGKGDTLFALKRYEEALAAYENPSTLSPMCLRAICSRTLLATKRHWPPMKKPAASNPIMQVSGVTSATC